MRAFDKIDISIGQVFVNVLLKGVVDDFVWACTAYMVLMTTTNGVLCRRSLQGCVLGGTQHGA